MDRKKKNLLVAVVLGTIALAIYIAAVIQAMSV
jgi:hypothetical protein